MAGPSLAQLDAKLAALPSSGAYLLFKADWCPDCVRSTQAVRDAVAAAGAQLLELDVGAPTAWKTPTHPLRTDPRFQLGGVPTLVFWSSGLAAAKLGRELERAPTAAAAAQVAAAFVKQTAAA
ncbi:thioredoxin Clot [Micractinium conductrix]|uniref:Thioredoxin Clot n=1 Tax=Micractinium conductrix TaxID=554055 RepID=A0A2P6VKR2_9CHLO|nr:thioredoxin Clot [Micractinium conductrix]|eukprot:PSC74668.1 thioredoxin Clot [Micractinium conductrix]